MAGIWTRLLQTKVPWSALWRWRTGWGFNSVKSPCRDRPAPFQKVAETARSIPLSDRKGCSTGNRQKQHREIFLYAFPLSSGL